MYFRNRRLIVPMVEILCSMLLISAIMPYLPRQIRQPYQIIKVLFLILLFLWVINGKRKELQNLFPIIFYASAFVISGIHNSIRMTSFLVTVSDALLYCDMYLVITKLMRQYSLENITTSFLKVAFFYLLFSDISAFLLEPGKEIIYFIGTKFRLSYLHWFVYILLLTRKNSSLMRSRILLFIYFVWSCIVILRVGCITGIIGLVAIACLSILYNLYDLKKILSPHYLIYYILLFLILFWSIEKLLKLDLVKIVIIKCLGRDLMLSGRLRIYEHLSEVAKNSLIWGYGYQNNAVSSVVGYGNAQNGIYEIIINYGLWGTFGFLFAVWNSCNKYIVLPEDIAPFYFLLIGLTIVSIIEVSFNNYYILALAIIYAYTRVNRSED